MGISTTEIIIIVAVIVLLFGGKKIPELMKGIGQGVRSFKEGLNNVNTEVQSTDSNNRVSTSHEQENTATQSHIQEK